MIVTDNSRASLLAHEAATYKGNPLVQARVKLGMLKSDIAEKADVAPGTIRQVERRELAPNSPVLPRIAAAYGLPAEAVAKWQRAKPMSEANLATQAKRLATIKSLGGLAAIYTKRGTKSANGNGNGNGNGVHAEKAEKPEKRSYRKGAFKHLSVEVREDLRTLVNTVNMNAMRGVKETTLPTPFLALLVRELMHARGVEQTVVLDPIDKLFD